MIGKHARRVIRFVPLGVLAALVIPMTVLAADASIQPTSATLVAKGAAVDVTVSFTCPAGDVLGGPFGFNGILLFVEQAVSKTSLATGSTPGGNGITCTGSPQSTDLIVPATPPGPPFRTGPALVSASLFACDAMNNCVNASSAPTTIRVTK